MLNPISLQPEVDDSTPSRWSRLLRVVASGLFLSASVLHGAVGVGSLQTFGTLPPVTDWSTLSVGGTGGGITTAVDFDVSVQTNTAASINQALVASTTVPAPGNNALARYSTPGGFIGTRPTGNAYTLLMATLVNSTAANIPSPIISYTFGVPTPVLGEDAELAGHRVYYSKTGLANSWVLIPELTSPTPTPVPASPLVTLSLGSWAPGSPLYIIWVDDNGGPGTDGFFSIDNFLVGTGVTAPEIVTQPVGTNVLQGQTITLRIQATGAGVTYAWQREGGSIDPANATVNQATLVITNAAPGDSDRYFCVVATTAGSLISTHVQVTVAPDTTAPQLLSAVGNALDLTVVDVKVSEALCLDPLACGGDVLSGSTWHVRDKANPFIELGVADPGITVNGTNVTIKTALERTAGVAYIVTVDAGLLSDRFRNSNPAELSVDLTPAVGFRQGPTYTGTHDTELRGAAPDTVQVNNTAITVDLDDAAGISQGLLRFEGVFGNNPDQVPLGAEIVSATLTLVHSVANAGGDPVEMHRLLIPFDEATATYNNFGATPGLQADGTEAAVNVDARIISAGLATPFTLNIDVTPTVQAWANGAPNYGWGFIPTGTDGYRIDSSESVNPPALSIIYKIVPCATEPSITQQPAGISVNEGVPFTLAATVTACSPSFQWTKDGIDIPGATESVYTAVAVPGPAGSSGQYRLRISNPNGTVTSQLAVVTVISDSIAPANLTAVVNEDGSVLTLTFSEPMAGNASNPANYRVDGIAPISATLANGTNVSLSLSSLDPCAVHTVIILPGVTDLASPVGNAVTAASRTHAFRVPLVLLSRTQVWKYDASGADLGTAWSAIGFDDSAWRSGPGILAWEPDNNFPAGWALGTSLTNYTNAVFAPARPTFYFRTHFNHTTTGLLTALEWFEVLDDGAAVYLNGQLVHTNRLLSPFTHATLALTGNLEPHPVEGPFALPTSALRLGDNVIAVEVHQSSTSSSDIVFGSILRAEFAACGVGLRVTAVSATQARLEWDDPSYRVDTAPAPTGPWTRNNVLVSGGLISINAGNQFQRLSKP